ncbi:hypothetical protein PHYSODRAFT_331436 [Phytophthora sojae]|uniref:Uncharacterized protein n=1 Tax=Phytophthora sojae (strain P6497) TaxID=1094619 RepID=G4ZEX2_PHYSP|nr:hypothetical protein PHYSODRAFT_331436 [Phytophthora sojae]EGZ17468.1 hypothetical protein PHYSODRAFT_331436 [Phytophthora sojae]|eukprot:XP_009526526.1 hypothetical protein PHYSODRAFT_331436 [Phytophthora sojae]
MDDAWRLRRQEAVHPGTRGRDISELVDTFVHRREGDMSTAGLQDDAVAKLLGLSVKNYRKTYKAEFLMELDIRANIMEETVVGTDVILPKLLLYISGSRRSIVIFCFDFTLYLVAKALVVAMERGLVAKMKGFGEVGPIDQIADSIAGYFSSAEEAVDGDVEPDADPSQVDLNDLVEPEPAPQPVAQEEPRAIQPVPYGGASPAFELRRERALKLALLGPFIEHLPQGERAHNPEWRDRTKRIDKLIKDWQNDKRKKLEEEVEAANARACPVQ